MTRYYSTQRPIGPGCIPSSPKPVGIENFDDRRFVESIGRKAWGYVEYEETLYEKTAAEYELEKEKRRYGVRFSVTGHYTATVLADSIEEAREKAVLDLDWADFGELCGIDWNISSVLDGEGNPMVML